LVHAVNLSDSLAISFLRSDFRSQARGVHFPRPGLGGQVNVPHICTKYSTMSREESTREESTNPELGPSVTVPGSPPSDCWHGTTQTRSTKQQYTGNRTQRNGTRCSARGSITRKRSVSDTPFHSHSSIPNLSSPAAKIRNSATDANAWPSNPSSRCSRT